MHKCDQELNGVMPSNCSSPNEVSFNLGGYDLSLSGFLEDTCGLFKPLRTIWSLVLYQDHPGRDVGHI